MFQELEDGFIDYIEVEASDVQVRTALSTILTWAESHIYSIYGVSIIERTITETLNGTGLSKLYTSKGEIVSVTSLKIDGEDTPLDTLKIKKNLIIYPDNTFIAGDYNIEVTYTIGYSSVDLIPPSLINAMYVIGRKMHTDATKNFDSIALISSDTKQSVKPLDSIPFLADSILQAYRIFRL